MYFLSTSNKATIIMIIIIIIILIIIIIIIIIITTEICMEIPLWYPVGDSRVSWAGWGLG